MVYYLVSIKISGENDVKLERCNSVRNIGDWVDLVYVGCTKTLVRCAAVEAEELISHANNHRTIIEQSLPTTLLLLPLISADLVQGQKVVTTRVPMG